MRQPHAADDRGLHRVVFLTLLPLGLAATPRRATGRPNARRTARCRTATAAATGAAAETTATTGRAPTPPPR
ncbi:hypothetical protein L838_1278 [Mycobacterium avium MAV_120709_2344]|nr:hypothetical protein L838_1278 [Mycobacterium avium MAV_120709_2344]